MKFLQIIFVFVSVFVGLFLLLSCVGLLWFKWHDIINSGGWVEMYSLFIGWWIAAICAYEYNETHQLEY